MGARRETIILLRLLKYGREGRAKVELPRELHVTVLRPFIGEYLRRLLDECIRQYGDIRRDKDEHQYGRYNPRRARL